MNFGDCAKNSISRDKNWKKREREEEQRAERETQREESHEENAITFERARGESRIIEQQSPAVYPLGWYTAGIV